MRKREVQIHHSVLLMCLRAPILWFLLLFVLEEWQQQNDRGWSFPLWILLRYSFSERFLRKELWSCFSSVYLWGLFFSFLSIFLTFSVCFSDYNSLFSFLSLFCCRHFILGFCTFSSIMSQCVGWFWPWTFAKYPFPKHTCIICFTLWIYKLIDQTGFGVILVIMQVNSKSRPTYSMWTVKCNYYIREIKE